MQAVLGPEPPVVEAGRGEEVDDGDAVLPAELLHEGLHPQDGGQQPGAAGHPPGGVGAGEQDDGGAGGAQFAGAVGEQPLDPLDVAAGAQHVVEAAGQGDELGAHRGGGGELLGVDLADELAADGEVGVPEVAVRLPCLLRPLGVLRRQRPGDAVGPALVVAVGQQVVAHALGEGVTDGDVTGVAADGGGHGLASALLGWLRDPTIVRPRLQRPARGPHQAPTGPLTTALIARRPFVYRPGPSSCHGAAAGDGGLAAAPTPAPAVSRQPATAATSSPATTPASSAAFRGVNQCSRTASVGRCSPRAGRPHSPSASMTGRSSRPRPVSS